MIPKNELFEVSSTYWLTVMALGLCVVCGYFWRLVVGKSVVASPWQRATVFAAAVVLCLTAVDGLNFTLRDLSGRFRITGAVVVIATTASLTWLHLSQWKTPRDLFRRRPSGWLMLLSSLAVVGWSYHRFDQRLYSTWNNSKLVIRTPGAKAVMHEFLAITDRNHSIPVYRLAEEIGEPTDEFMEVIVDSHGSMIQRGPANSFANCHGWVFLDSQFLISGEAVQKILDDNGYEHVAEPKAGDVIIYRDDDRNIIHSGIVRGVLDDNTVIIESKWGTEGTFLHAPAGTPYGAEFEYHRSPRHDNRVKVVHVEEAPVDG